jgi:tripeptide aminopeptidase
MQDPVATDVLDLFLELLRLPSPSGEERAVADRVLAYLDECGLEASEDGSGALVGSTMGNIHLALEPTVDGEPLFFCAHLDTVPPTDAIEPVIVEGIVRNARPTILGADNKAAVVAMVAALGQVATERRPHAGVELLLTSKEEVGLLGAFAFDHTRLRARCGYVYDSAAPIGEIILGAPAAQQLNAVFHGRAAHAGMVPEQGRSSIAAAARAVADMQLGRLDDETTANIGLINGGSAANIVPEWCSLVGEARSHDEHKLSAQVQAMQHAMTFAANLHDCSVETTWTRGYSAYRFTREDLPVRLAATALASCGIEPFYALSGGAADANVFNTRELRCVNLANGMADIHTSDEHIAVDDIAKMVDVPLALIDAART